MGFHSTLEEFSARHGSMDPEAFNSKFKEPFLLLEVGFDEKTDAFQTLNGTKNPERATEPIRKASAVSMYSLVVPLVKTDRNSFQNMVTVGRATNNDVIVSHPSVSKFHSYFRVDPASGSATITEAGSSYGTLLDNRPLAKNEATPLKSGAVILFAHSVKATFFTAADLYGLLHP